MATSSIARTICFGIVLLPITAAETLPFAFGNSVMAYLNTNVTSVTQYTKGFIVLLPTEQSFAGFVYVYNADIDTRNGGANQNQIWLRTGNRTDDLKRARDIIAGSGTFFAPQAVIVATWFRVEGCCRRVGPQNTFQLALAYSATGETWAIFAYEQLQFYEPFSRPGVLVEYRNDQNVVVTSSRLIPMLQ